MMWIPIAILLFVAVYVWSLYNGLIISSTQVSEAWSQIDVQLKRRMDLIPNIVESVKGFAKHEKSIFENVSKARSALMSADTPDKSAKANDMLSGALKSLFAVAENYPQLKANENFLHLQKEISDTEDKVAYARQFYNSIVRDFNVKVKIFPNSILANSFGFKEKSFFEVQETERQSVKVQF